MIKTVITNYLDFCNWLKENKQPILGFDTETTSLSFLEMECIGFSLATDKAACYVIPDKPDNLIEYFMQLKGITLVMHNAVFDLKVLYKYGYEPEKIFCTLTGAKLCDENRQHYNLKDLATDWLKVPYKTVRRYEEVCTNTNSKEFYNYAMQDAIWTYQLYQYEMKILKKENLVYLAEEVEMPFQFVLRDLEINGVFIDTKKLEVFKHECSKILHNIEADMLACFGKCHNSNTNLFGEIEYTSPINFNSSTQLVCCIENLGMVITEKTNPTKRFPEGQKSVNKVTKARLKGKHSFIDLMIRRSKLIKLYDGFIEPLTDFIDFDGRVRPSYNMVRTGRLSCSDPNLQQLPNPKREKLEFNHRELFIPEEGNVFVCADYSGQELRNLAEVSNDKNMVDAFGNNLDLHLVTANHIFSLGLANDSLKEGTPNNIKARITYKTQRHQAKNGVNFPTIYGAFAQRVAQDNHVSVQEAQRWLDEFDKLYPGVKRWKEQVTNKIKRQHYTSTLMGRRRRFPYYDQEGKWEQKRIERQAANSEIQGFSADQVKIAAIKIVKSGILQKYRVRIVLCVHDELVWELPEEYAKEFSCEVKYIMEHAVSMKIPILVDVKIVRSYGE